MSAPSPPSTGGDEAGGSSSARRLTGWAIWQIGALIVAGVALAAFLWQITDKRSGPAIVIEDARADATIVVQVTGAVATPGVYGVPYGARLDDALDRAGGTLPDADLAAFNLARRLDDGEQIVVPRVRPTPTPLPPGRPTPPPPTMGPTDPPSVAATGATVGTEAAGETIAPASIDLNTATAAELVALPEIGEVRAAAIVAYREANGPFESVDELVNVDGISERIVDIIRPYVTVGA